MLLVIECRGISHFGAQLVLLTESWLFRGQRSLQCGRGGSGLPRIPPDLRTVEVVVCQTGHPREVYDPLTELRT